MKKRRDLEQEERNWLDLPADLTLLIFSKLGVGEILLGVQKVCSSWWKLCKEPKLFQFVVIAEPISNCSFGSNVERYTGFIKEAVDRSCGQLTEFSTRDGLCTDEILRYVVSKSGLIKRLRILRNSPSACSYITTNGLIEAVRNAPLLQDLEVHASALSMEELVKEAGQSCLQLKCFSLRSESSTDGALEFAIAENMTQLRKLRISGCRVLTEAGLRALLERCIYLEYLEFVDCTIVGRRDSLKEMCDDRGIHLCGQQVWWCDWSYGFRRYTDGKDFV